MNSRSLLTVKESADFLRLSKATLDEYRCTGKGPLYRKLGGRILYRLEDLDAWVDDRAFTSTSEAQSASATMK